MMKLTEIARKTLEGYFKDEKFVPDEKTREKYKEKRACFVTLTLNSYLRGCIGTLEARQELWKDVVENTINAAFYDSRFSPLSYGELPRIKIEVSVLSKPERLEFKDENDLLNKIDNQMGIILEKDSRSSTFLPQVWEEIPNKTAFLEELSMKAGLDKDAWREKGTNFQYYRVEAEKE